MTDDRVFFDRAIPSIGFCAPGKRSLADAVRVQPTIARRLLALRREIGLTQIQMSAVLGVTQQALSLIEQGQRGPSPRFRAALRRLDLDDEVLDLFAPESATR